MNMPFPVAFEEISLAPLTATNHASPYHKPFDPSICGATASTTHEFSRTHQRSRNGKVSGCDETFSRRLYVHIFYSPANEAKKELAFRKDLLELKAQVENGVVEF